MKNNKKNKLNSTNKKPSKTKFFGMIELYRKQFGTIGYFSILIILILILFRGQHKNKQTNEICYKTNCFHIEIADSPEAREKGLMYLEKLGEQSGMLFIFPQDGIYPFWMKNTLIPLDMIRLNSGFKVIDIMQAIPCKSDPCQIYSPIGKSKYILEINGGISQKIGLKIGDIFKLR